MMADLSPIPLYLGTSEPREKLIALRNDRMRRRSLEPAQLPLIAGIAPALVVLDDGCGW